MQAAGGFRNDTLAEDMDLTWRVRRAGWRIDNEPHAVALHRSARDAEGAAAPALPLGVRHAAVSVEASRRARPLRCVRLLMLPSLWLFQIAFQVLSPIIDVQVLITLFRFGRSGSRRVC